MKNGEKNGERSPEDGDRNNIDNENRPDFNRPEVLNMSSSRLLGLSVGSAVVYMVLALVIFRFFHGSGIAAAFERGYSVSFQFTVGILSGIAASAVIGFMSDRPPISEVLHDFYIVELLSKMKMTTGDRIQLSLFAGAGEEILFRGGNPAAAGQ